MNLDLVIDVGMWLLLALSVWALARNLRQWRRLERYERWVLSPALIGVLVYVALLTAGVDAIGSWWGWVLGLAFATLAPWCVMSWRSLNRHKAEAEAAMARFEQALREQPPQP